MIELTTYECGFWELVEQVAGEFPGTYALVCELDGLKDHDLIRESLLSISRSSPNPIPIQPFIEHTLAFTQSERLIGLFKSVGDSDIDEYFPHLSAIAFLKSEPTLVEPLDSRFMYTQDLLGDFDQIGRGSIKSGIVNWITQHDVVALVAFAFETFVLRVIPNP